ncbi:MAG: GNAT family N-acetyltransferase [Actinobacteria bacterium]|nr:GNAT family N-acetyltransferase [Actinomycetota bacterium]MBW3649806.1 GNAT family N-acetyltransferase [Actinomycetota bacterium]
MQALVRVPETEEEWRACYAVSARSFNLPLTEAKEQEFLEKVHRDRSLAAFVDGEVAAWAQVRPFGQFFGGRSVAMGGYSPVAAAPEHRGLGLATLVTVAHFPLMRERGEVISGLYPASTQLYRNAGFELGGAFTHREFQTRSLHHIQAPGGLRARRAKVEDLPAIKDCYRRFASTQPGWLDRPDVWWEKLLPVESFDEHHVYVVGAGGGAVRGYVRYLHVPREPWGYNVAVQELCAEEPEVVLALWRLVGSSSTQAEFVKAVAPPEHPLLLLLPDQEMKTPSEIRWMTRIVDAPAAIAARGYPPGVEVSVDIDLDDAHCEWNQGRWRLTVEDGRGVLERGGAGEVTMSVNALATLYTGYASATTLQQAGLLASASPETLPELTAAFAGPTPWCVDFY